MIERIGAAGAGKSDAERQVQKLTASSGAAVSTVPWLASPRPSVYRAE